MPIKIIANWIDNQGRFQMNEKLDPMSPRIQFKLNPSIRFENLENPETGLDCSMSVSECNNPWVNDQNGPFLILISNCCTGSSVLPPPLRAVPIKTGRSSGTRGSWASNQHHHVGPPCWLLAAIDGHFGWIHLLRLDADIVHLIQSVEEDVLDDDDDHHIDHIGDDGGGVAGDPLLRHHQRRHRPVSPETGRFQRHPPRQRRPRQRNYRQRRPRRRWRLSDVILGGARVRRFHHIRSSSPVQLDSSSMRLNWIKTVNW